MNQMEDYLVEDMWGEMRAIFGDRIDCEEAIDAYKDGDYVRAEKLLPKDALQYLHQIIADFTNKLKHKEKREEFNLAQKWYKSNGIEVDMDDGDFPTIYYTAEVNGHPLYLNEMDVKYRAELMTYGEF
jgi:hypothetical protein